MADRAFMTLNGTHQTAFDLLCRLFLALLCLFTLCFTASTSQASEGFRQNLKANQAYLEGQIKTSFAKDGQLAGLPKAIVDQMIDMFAWDIDFAKDIQAYDRFRVIYQDDPINKPYVIAAQLVVQKRTFTSVRYVTQQGVASYYTPEGFSTRKAFLRMPVEYARISSRFNPNRRHPILNTIRAHKGVDYAARKGTPVRATGDGRVTWAERKGGYGNTVIIDHGDQITTLYAHLSRFSTSLKKGSRVKQGQIIGYIGMTGLATGPHLHYEFRIAQEHQDPLSVELEHTYPIHVRERLRFRNEANQKLALLSLYAMRFASRD